MKYDINPQETLTCPICNKEFKPNNDTKYIIAGGYTCSWKCFLKESKRRNTLRQNENERKNKNKNK